MQFLLISHFRQSQSYALYRDYEAAKAAAIAHVGEHYPVDAVSQPRQEFENRAEGLYRTWRSSSFGNRKAEVILVVFAD